MSEVSHFDKEFWFKQGELFMKMLAVLSVFLLQAAHQWFGKKKQFQRLLQRHPEVFTHTLLLSLKLKAQALEVEPRAAGGT